MPVDVSVCDGVIVHCYDSAPAGMAKFFTDAKYKGRRLVKSLESKHRCSIQMREVEEYEYEYEYEEDYSYAPLLRKVIFNIKGTSPTVVEAVIAEIQAIINDNYTETREVVRGLSAHDFNDLKAEIRRHESDTVSIQIGKFPVNVDALLSHTSCSISFICYCG
jgi:hypothetical protein